MRKAVKFRTTVILIAVFAVLLGYFFLVENKRAPSSTIDESLIPRTTPVFEYQADDVVEITFSRGEQRTVARRNDAEAPWMLFEPVQDEGDASLLDAAARRFATLQAHRVITDTEITGDLAEFGLDSPAITGTMKLKDGQEITVYFGDRTPDNTNIYMRKQGEEGTIYVVNTILSTSFENMLATPPIKPTPTPTWTPTSTPTLTATLSITITATPGITGTSTPTATPQNPPE